MTAKEKSSGVLERRGSFLASMRQMTFEVGHFTTTDLALVMNIPRSTAQDWINRLVKEGCIFVKDESHGRNPARYASRSALPQTTCKRIFTTSDGNDVEIFHECLSSGCAGFCEFHHKKAGGAALSVTRDGMIFLERAKLGVSGELHLDTAAVGLASVKKDGPDIVQTIRSIPGGPAYSLSSMMSHAKGVKGVEIVSANGVITGEVRTTALVHVTIGVDDTDLKGCGGATFALSQALMKYLTDSGEVIGIRHQVAVLCQDIPEKTAGNSCSFIELAVEPGAVPMLSAKVCRFLEEESVSEEWGIAIFTGINVPSGLLMLGKKIREERVSLNEVLQTAKHFGVQVYGHNGIIGAVGAVSLKNQPQEVLLDLTNQVVIR
ncbi:MAG: sugar-specific transcriptional regulator TrmB [Methanocorpusculum sp.]|nr:sugar-specific transcriptional regulator TrmB [Methanocorpusculum sp.]MDD3257092.1 sugar-specific transcriptional regulator TrmB [Methanocorpusculum sp.]